MTRTRVRQLTHDGLPKKGRNEYPLIACIHWYIAFLKKKHRVTDQSIEEERKRLTREKADALELKNKQTRKELIPAKEVEHVWSGMILNAKSRLLALPSKIAPIAAELDDPRKIQVEVKALIYEALEELGTGNKPRKKTKPRKVATST